MNTSISFDNEGKKSSIKCDISRIEIVSSKFIPEDNQEHDIETRVLFIDGDKLKNNKTYTKLGLHITMPLTDASDKGMYVVTCMAWFKLKSDKDIMSDKYKEIAETIMSSFMDNGKIHGVISTILNIMLCNSPTVNFED